MLDVIYALVAVSAIIAIDAIFGVLLAIKKGGFNPSKGGFNFRLLPNFLATSVLPDIGGLLALAIIPVLGPRLPEIADSGITGFFYAASAASAVKHLLTVKDKAAQLFGITAIEGESALTGKK